MFSIQILLGTVITLGIVVFHVGGLVVLASTLTKMGKADINHAAVRGRMILLITTVLFILAIHTIEAWFWAGIFLWLGEFAHLGDALYFSVVTATTLGYGDLTLSPRWQLLGTFEAMGGLILFGASTAFLLEVTRQMFDKRQ